MVKVTCRGQGEEELGLVVVGGKGPSLLGRDCLDRLRLDWRFTRSTLRSTQRSVHWKLCSQNTAGTNLVPSGEWRSSYMLLLVRSLGSISA